MRLFLAALGSCKAVLLTGGFGARLVWVGGRGRGEMRGCAAGKEGGKGKRRYISMG